MPCKSAPLPRASVCDGYCPEPDAPQLGGQPDKQQQSAISIGSAQRIQNLVFPIAVVPDIGSIDVDGLPWRCLLHGLAPASVLAQRHYSLLF